MGLVAGPSIIGAQGIEESICFFLDVSSANFLPQIRGLGWGCGLTHLVAEPLRNNVFFECVLRRGILKR